MSAMEFTTPVGRLVQGSMSLQNKTDMQTNQPKVDPATGLPIKEIFFALAIAKNDPALPAFVATLSAAAHSEFPHLFDAAGNMTNPQFSWKIQDGDGVDNNGQSVATKPGFAGHMIFKFGTRFPVRCYHKGKYDPMQQIQNPDEVIKRGYYIRVAGMVRGNGVAPSDRQKKPGIMLSPSMVELVAYGDEIQSGPDASAVFGAAPVNSLPPGATEAPAMGVPAPQVPAPQVPMATMTAPPMGIPAMPVPPPVAIPVTPPAGPAYVMTPAAQGATREQLIAQGWTDETLLQHGLMVAQ